MSMQPENPMAPAGWAIDPGAAAQAGEDRAAEGMAVEQQKRRDTAAEADRDNRPFEDAQNPAQPGGYEYERAASTRVARVFHTADMKERGSLAGARVLLRGPGGQAIGRISSVGQSKFVVAWDDGRETVEDKADGWQLVQTPDTVS